MDRQIDGQTNFDSWDRCPKGNISKNSVENIRWFPNI